jgi:signal transduction histidine kinase
MPAATNDLSSDRIAGSLAPWIEALATTAHGDGSRAWKNRRYPTFDEGDDRACALQFQLTRRQAIVAALTANDVVKTLRHLQWLAESDARQPTALWIERDGDGVGIDVWGCTFAGRRRIFENDRLAGFLRFARRHELDDGLRATAYAAGPLPESFVWAEIAGRALERFLATTGSTTPTNSILDSLGLDDRYWPIMAEFSAGAGHEINNPLGAIAGQAELLLADERDPARRTALQRIRDQVQRIRGMIADLHLIGRRKVPPNSRFPLADAVERAVTKSANWGGMHASSVRLGPLDREVVVWGRAGEIERIVYELIRNAQKSAGPNGWVRIDIEVRERVATLSVSDSGPGFDADARRFGLTPFYSGRSAGRGLGMGLSVVKRLVADHGGALRVHPGRPTAVSVTLPIAEAVSPSKTRAA